MIKKQSKQNSNRKKIDFLLQAPHADKVFLAGDFNQWNSKKHPMKKGKAGVWEKTLMLAPGIYEYKYMVDGCWQEDIINQQNCLNPFGTYNQRLTVPE